MVPVPTSPATLPTWVTASVVPVIASRRITPSAAREKRQHREHRIGARIRPASVDAFTRRSASGSSPPTQMPGAEHVQRVDHDRPRGVRLHAAAGPPPRAAPGRDPSSTASLSPPASPRRATDTRATGRRRRASRGTRRVRARRGRPGFRPARPDRARFERRGRPIRRGPPCVPTTTRPDASATSAAPRPGEHAPLPGLRGRAIRAACHHDHRRGADEEDRAGEMEPASGETERVHPASVPDGQPALSPASFFATVPSMLRVLAMLALAAFVLASGPADAHVGSAERVAFEAPELPAASEAAVPTQLLIANGSTEFPWPLTLIALLAAAALVRRRSRGLVAAVLVLLIAILGVEAAVHSVHHAPGSQPVACPTASVAAHLDGTTVVALTWTSPSTRWAPQPCCPSARFTPPRSIRRSPWLLRSRSRRHRATIQKFPSGSHGRKTPIRARSRWRSRSRRWTRLRPTV